MPLEEDAMREVGSLDKYRVQLSLAWKAIHIGLPM